MLSRACELFLIGGQPLWIESLLLPELQMLPLAHSQLSKSRSPPPLPPAGYWSRRVPTTGARGFPRSSNVSGACWTGGHLCPGGRARPLCATDRRACCSVWDRRSPPRALINTFVSIRRPRLHAVTVCVDWTLTRHLGRLIFISTKYFVRRLGVGSSNALFPAPDSPCSK